MAVSRRHHLSETCRWLCAPMRSSVSEVGLDTRRGETELVRLAGARRRLLQIAVVMGSTQAKVLRRTWGSGSSSSVRMYACVYPVGIQNPVLPRIRLFRGAARTIAGSGLGAAHAVPASECFQSITESNAYCGLEIRRFRLDRIPSSWLYERIVKPGRALCSGD